MLSKLILIGILGATLVYAQRGGGGGSRGGRGDISSTTFASATRFDRISEMLKLNKDQKKEAKATLDEAQKEAMPVHEQLTKGRDGIAEAIAAGKSQDEINQLVKSNSALEARIAGIELKSFATIYKSLDQDQQTKTAPMFLMMKGMFNGKNWNSSE